MFAKRGSRLSISGKRREMVASQTKPKLTGGVDECEIHRGGNDGFGESSEEILDHVANSIDIGAAIDWCAPYHSKDQQRHCSWAGRTDHGLAHPLYY
jgi:hypothetical protein